MPPQSKRRRVYDVPNPSIDAAAWSSDQRQAGADLLKHLLSLLALSKLSSKDFCICCHYLALIGTPGADFSAYALGPDQTSSGNYQKLLDKVLPSLDTIDVIDIPCTSRTPEERQSMSLPMNPVHEALANELRGSPLDSPVFEEMPRAYQENSLVQRARREGRALPIPWVLYLDSVRFSAPLAGRSDSVLGIWAYTLSSQRRHLLASVRTKDFCRCGCRGWDTIFPILWYVSRCAKALAEGRRSSFSFDDRPLPAPLAEKQRQHGDELGFSCMLLYVKQDWGEAAHSLGLPSVVAKHSPCPYCTCTKATLHLQYQQISVGDWPWEPHVHSYEEMCAAREVSIQIIAEDERALLSSALEYIGKPKGRGRTVVLGIVIGGVQLEVGDRLVPSPLMLDTAVVDFGPLPLQLLFWRERKDNTGAIRDAVINRCPLFNDELGTSPKATLAVDSLHTLNYGPMMRLCSAAIWRVLLSNPWSFGGNTETRLDLCCRRLRTHLFEWYERRGIPAADRLGDLTIAMLGSPTDCTFNDGSYHRGCNMRTKAAETAMVLDWTMDLIRDYPRIHGQPELLAAGMALQEWIDTTAMAPFRVPVAAQQRLCDLAIRHLLNAEAAGVDLIPKHHAFAHLAFNIGWLGNSKAYSTFLDESLNLLLRTVTAAAHRAKQAWRILNSLNLIGSMRLSPFIYGNTEG